MNKNVVKYIIMKENIKLQYIGKINTELYKEISQKIITDEVVLTDKQREHIEQRHPEILEKYEKYFAEIVELFTKIFTKVNKNDIISSLTLLKE